jgi:cytidyltransferase-like protein
MQTFEHGVVLGKFYPPHRGHKFLIDTALERCQRVSVIVVFKEGQTIPGELRAALMRKIHPRANVLMVNQGLLADRDPLGWARATINWLGRRPDAAFTSETYGDAWCQAMGCQHILVDLGRSAVPISGTQVRANPLAALSYLEPIVQEYFLKLEGLA